MNSKSPSPSDRPPFWLAALVCLAVVSFYAYLRLVYYASALAPLTFALPLLLTLWHRDRRLHFSIAVIFSATAFAKLFLYPTVNPGDMSPAAAFLMILCNIWIVAVVIEWLLVSRERLKAANEHLAESNEELEAMNEELSAREEEISSQNEELQRLSEEMEQQMEELQEQSEELQHQSEELQEMQELSQGRQCVLQSLFRLSTRLDDQTELETVFDGICEAATEAFGDQISVAALTEYCDGDLILRGRWGVSEESWKPGEGFDDPLTRHVVVEGKTAGIENLRETPDVRAPRLGNSTAAAATLIAPLRRRQRVNGAIAIYSDSPREWTETDFQTIEWLAAQGALLLEAFHMRDELDRRGREAEKATKRKTQFLAAVSHDVRTPANAINLAAEVLHRSADSPQLRHQMPEMLDSLRSSAKQLVELVTDVLDISRLDSGKVDLDETVFNLCEVLQNDVDRFRVVGQQTGIDVSTSLPDTPVWIRTDRMKLIRVIGNLLGNAVKFTDRGSVIAECVCTEHDAEIRISDTGVGIPADNLEHVFDEFFQVNNPERDRSKGTGLGLAICRRLIDALGFSISVQSQVGKGTTFTIRIPSENVVCNPDQLDLPAALQMGDETLRGCRVLLVEDHEPTRTAVARLLQMQGADVKLARDAREALDSLNHDRPEILLLDMMLPDMDGREVLKRLNQNRPPELRCVLAVSGDVTAERIQEVADLGADGLVQKPVQLDALLQRIAAVIGSTESAAEDIGINR